ncbi:MAG: GNVR domain-containing protein [Candidatus Ancaeobacter aquaticus]|nr:GNVR domain-containing protein [Candidatus Ancaeobacter aquaticus]
MVDLKEITLRDYLLILYKRKWIILLCVFTVTISSLIFAPTPPPVYEAFTTVLIENPAQSTPLLEGLSSPLKSTQLETQAELITSRTVADNAVKFLKLNMMSAVKERGGEAEWLNSGNVVDHIRKSISVSRVGNTNLLVIKVRAGTPIKARDIANSVAKAFVSQSMKASSQETQTARQFIERQVDSYAKKLQESEDKLTSFKTKEQYTTIEKEIQRLSIIENTYIDTKSEREITESKLQALKQQLSDLNITAVPSLANVQSTIMEGLREKLISLELQRSLLLRDYTDKHPALIELKKEIDATVKDLRAEFSIVSKEGLPSLDPWANYQNLLNEHINLEIVIKALKVREDALKKQMEDFTEQLNDLASKKAEYLKLTRQLKISEETYLTLLEKLEEIKIAESMESGNVRIIDLAILPKHAIEVSEAQKGILGALLGLFIGIGMAFLLEHLDTSLKSISEVERYLNVQVLGVIPKIPARESYSPSKQE